MAGYGFRLYTVKLVNGYQKSKATEFDKCGMRRDEHVGTWVRRALAVLEGHEPLTGPPVLHLGVDEEALPEIDSYVRKATHGEYRTRFRDHTESPATRIRFRLEYGRVGKVSVGVLDDDSMDLSDTPVGDVYRGILYLPPDGTRGLLALVVGRGRSGGRLGGPSQPHPVQLPGLRA